MVIMGGLLLLLLAGLLTAMRFRFFGPMKVPAHFPTGLMLVLTTVVAVPLSEELFWRVFGMPYVMQKTTSTRALILTALGFGILHGIFKLPYAFLLGLFSGWLLLRTRSIQLSLLLHFIINAIGVGTILLWSGPCSIDFMRLPVWLPVLLLPMGVIMYLFFHWIKRQMDLEYPNTIYVSQETVNA